jgi:hypothetical protein
VPTSSIGYIDNRVSANVSWCSASGELKIDAW